MLETNFTPFPVIITERLILRRFTHDDAPGMFELRSNKEVMQYIARPIAKTLDEAVALINVIHELLDKNEGITWCIALKNSDKYIGSIGFWRIEKDNYRAEIGYMLNPAYQGKGIMQEALSVVIEYGFNTMKLHSIEAHIAPENIASVKLLERNGFAREAHFKENLFFNGRFLDTVIYSLLTLT